MCVDLVISFIRIMWEIVTPSFLAGVRSAQQSMPSFCVNLYCNFSSTGDLEMVEEKYEKAKQELEQTLAELTDM